MLKNLGKYWNHRKQWAKHRVEKHCACYRSKKEFINSEVVYQFTEVRTVVLHEKRSCLPPPPPPRAPRNLGKGLETVLFSQQRVDTVTCCVKPGLLLTAPSTGQSFTTDNKLAQNISRIGIEKLWASKSGRRGEWWTLQIGIWVGIHF